jgi:energy-coupling factor transporter ATP-binding protein EcfA2
MLKRILVSNLPPFGQEVQELTVDDLKTGAVVVGENGSGKTSLFRALRVLLDSRPKSWSGLSHHAPFLMAEFALREDDASLIVAYLQYAQRNSRHHDSHAPFPELFSSDVLRAVQRKRIRMKANNSTELPAEFVAILLSDESIMSVVAENFFRTSIQRFDRRTLLSQTEAVSSDEEAVRRIRHSWIVSCIEADVPRCLDCLENNVEVFLEKAYDNKQFIQWLRRQSWATIEAIMSFASPQQLKWFCSNGDLSEWLSAEEGCGDLQVEQWQVRKVCAGFVGHDDLSQMLQYITMIEVSSETAPVRTVLVGSDRLYVRNCSIADLRVLDSFAASRIVRFCRAQSWPADVCWPHVSCDNIFSLGGNSNVVRQHIAAFKQIVTEPEADRDSVAISLIDLCVNVLRTRLKFLPEHRGLLSGPHPLDITMNQLAMQLFAIKNSQHGTTRFDEFSAVFSRLSERLGRYSLKSWVDTSSYVSSSDATQAVLPVTPKLGFMKGRDTSVLLDVDQVPGGLWELLLVLAALYCFDAQTIILDEPGRTLHPDLLTDLVDHIVKVVLPTRKITVVIVTHLSQFIREDTLEMVYRCSVSPSGSRICSWKKSCGEDPQDRRFFSDPRVRDLFFSTGALWVEGKWDVLFFRALRRSCLKEVVKEADIPVSFKFDVFPMDGKASMERAFKVCRLLGVPYAVVCDRDAVESVTTVSSASSAAVDLAKQLEKAQSVIEIAKKSASKLADALGNKEVPAERLSSGVMSIKQQMETAVSQMARMEEQCRNFLSENCASLTSVSHSADVDWCTMDGTAAHKAIANWLSPAQKTEFQDLVNAKNCAGISAWYERLAVFAWSVAKDIEGVMAILDPNFTKKDWHSLRDENVDDAVTRIWESSNPDIDRLRTFLFQFKVLEK